MQYDCPAVGVLRALVLPAAIAATASLAVAVAQVPPPRVVLMSGESTPGVPGFATSDIEWLGTNHDGGLVASLNLVGPGGNSDRLWGSLGGGSAGTLRAEGAAGPVVVTSFDRACAGAGGRLVYLATVAGGPDALMLDDTVVARVGDSTAPGGASWLRFDEPFVDSSGRPWFRGRYTNTPNSSWGLFRGTALTPVLLPDGVVTGLPLNVSTGGGPESAYDVSPSGSHWIGTVVAQNSRTGVVRDGEVLSAGGVPLVTGNLLPAAFALVPNEAYNVFGQTQVTDGDHWAVIGGTPTGFILRDGAMHARPGNVVDGWPLADSFRAIAMQRHGGLAWIGRVQAGLGQQPYAVFREDTLLYKEGDPVDFDGDGVADPGYEIAEIPGGAGRLAYTEDGVVWARVKVRRPNGSTPWSLVAVGEPFGLPYCSSQLNSSGARARAQAAGSAVLAANALRVRCVDMPDQTFGYFLCSRVQGLVPGAGGSQGDLCLGGAVGRLNAQIVNSGATGAIEVPVDLLALPQPTGFVAAVVGESWNFQCWFRDANPTVTSNFSDGVEILVR